MCESTDLKLSDYIREVPDFPKPGILYYDITTLLASPKAFRKVISELADHYRAKPIDVIVAAEARGFIFAAPLALELDVAMAPIRKPGKLPYETVSFSYELEYGTDTLEMHIDAVRPGANVLVLDDLLATGGTVEACCHMVEQVGGNVMGCAFVVELLGLGGAAKIAQHDLFSLIKYE